MSTNLKQLTPAIAVHPGEILKDELEPTKDIETIKSIYKVNNFEQLAALYSKPYYSRFRKSEKLYEDKINIIGWVKLVEFRADQKIVNEFNTRKMDSLIEGLKEII